MSTIPAQKSRYYIPGEDPAYDSLQVLDKKGVPVGWIDSDGVPQGNMDTNPRIKTQRVSYTWTQANTDAGFAAVPFTFTVPFPDTNYSLVYGINDVSEVAPDLNYYSGDIHSKTAAGAVLVPKAYSPGFGTPGDVLILNIIAIHD